MFIFLYSCTFWLSWKVEKNKRMGEGILEKYANSACCNCVNITMLLDNYRIWRPMTMLHLFLWERIYSARKGFAICCASMQMCVICFFIFFFCIGVCCVALSFFDAWLWRIVLYNSLFYWTLVKHWPTYSIGFDPTTQK